ncbi:ribonuclease-like protein P complex subunit Pop4 [Macroventuria anomochaeta]|uniref:Ribonuclease-like protein P complex subunit Pop4 n=1 Tax=Macroventuria anomochaeta TaxID=301207 RepID=A0ACB6SBC4_9PLEO|nr:ribonuclease-like protein P complex subunit Pop4 [Macroventuria anomochaeta]KAF2631277.1 ribonuclease-like protein P complex subunit Pop4 [Macroventuria anomochaeta]
MAGTAGMPFGQALLQRAFSPDTAAIHYNDRIAKRPLPIRATSPTPSARAARRQALNERKDKARKRNTQKPRPLSAAQKRKLGLNEIPKEQQKYAIYEPLNNLWLGYMREILGLSSVLNAKVYITPSSAGQMLASADMHGAKLSVVRSRCVSRVGLEGIVVRDTRYTFEIVTRGDTVKSVPKEHTVFRFEIPLTGGREGEGDKEPLVFEIFGEQFQTRAPDRANKKFRLHYQPDL